MLFDKKLLLVAAVSAAVGAAAAVGVIAVATKLRSGKYCLCVPDNHCDCGCDSDCSDECDCGCQDEKATPEA